MMLYSWRDFAFHQTPSRAFKGVPCSVVFPQRHDRLKGLLQRQLKSQAQKEAALDSNILDVDVWTKDFISPQQRRAERRGPRGPLIPEFLVQHTEYNSDDYVEIGFVWKAIGTRGEVLLRVCTSLQDYRVGLPGSRYLLPWSGCPSDPKNPLATTPQPTLYHTRMRRASYKLHNIADSRHNVWQMILEGCHVNAFAQRLRGWRVFMHVADIANFDDSGGHAERAVVTAAQHMDSVVHPAKLRVDGRFLKSLDAESIRDFRVFVNYPPRDNTDHSITQNNNRHGGVADRSNDVDNTVSSNGFEHSLEEVSAATVLEDETPTWLEGATCIGRITDIYRDEGRFYDTGPYIDRLGYRRLPGECGMFRIAFRKSLVVHEFHASQQEEGCGVSGRERFVELDSLRKDDLMHVENAEELRELGHLSNGATPLWIRNAPSGLLPLLPRYLSHVDVDAEVALVHPDPQWLRDHMAVRMVKRRPPRRTEKRKLTMGGKYLKRVDKAFIKRKGRYHRKGRNLRKT